MKKNPQKPTLAGWQNARYNVVMNPVAGRQQRYPATPWSAQRLYRPFVLWALVVALTLGFTTGAAMLFLPVLGVQSGVAWLTHTQAHGVAQAFGWGGLFVVGVAYHVVPRFRNAPMPFPWPQRATLILVLAGIGLRSFGQTLYSTDASSVLLVASGVALLAGVGLFSGVMALTLRRGEAPHTPAEPWLWAGSLWALVAAAVHLAIVLKMAGAHAFAAPASWNNAFVNAVLVGFLGNFILGVSIRSVSAFMGLPAPGKAMGRAAFWAINGGVAWYVAALLWGAAPGWTAIGTVVEAVGVVAFVASLRLFARRSRPRGYIPGTYRRYEWFLRAAYGWLLVWAVLSALQALGLIWGGTVLPVRIGAPALHVLTLGFITMMIMGMAARMLPLFEGAQLPHQPLMDVAFLALNSSVLLRVVFGLTLTGASSAGLAVSGVLGLLALALFAWVVWQVLRPAARERYRRTAVTFVVQRGRQG